jgi:hypothetical protein
VCDLTINPNPNKKEHMQDKHAPNVIITLNHRLSKNPLTRLLTARMTQKPSILDAYGRYVITVRPYSSFISRNTLVDSLTRPGSLHLDGFEVLWGSDDLEDFEKEVLGLLDQQFQEAA